MMMNGTGMMIWGMFSFLSSLVLIVLFVALIVFAVKWFWGEKTPFSLRGNESALDILKKRYATVKSRNKSLKGSEEILSKYISCEVI